jgi:hypothetical protein
MKMKYLLLILSLQIASLVKSQHLNGFAPIKKNGIYSIKNRSQEMIIDPAIGGRITALKFNGINFLTTKEIHPIFWGSTLWPSPQKIWGGPDLVELDRSIYSDTAFGNTLKMVSRQDPHSGFVFSKEFSFNEKRAAFMLTYSITNGSDTIRQVAPWEVTRVQTGGLTFFPSRQGIRWGNMAGLATDSNNMTWFNYQPEKILSGHSKFFADGKEGWVAQINNGIIFIKCFADQPIELAAPSESEIEVYTNPDKTYVEVEVQGAYTSLKPGETLSWTVFWIIRKLPKINIESGSKDLIHFVHKQIHFNKK